MIKNIALVLALLLLALVAWGLLAEGGATHIIVNGRELTGPFQGAVGVAGMIVAVIALFCAAILLIFVFAGVGLFFLGCLLLLGLVMAGLAVPFSLLLLIPLAIVWIVVAASRRGIRSGRTDK